MALTAPSRSLRVLRLLTLLLLQSCGTDASSRGHDLDGSPDATADGARLETSDASDASGLPGILFRPCLLTTEGSTTTADCAAVILPLRHGDPTGATVSIYVERIRATSTPTSALWLVEGGPGDPATKLEPLALSLHDLLPTFDIFLSDQRGTGLSTRFECPLSIAQNAGGDPLPACGDEIRRTWGDDTGAFSTTESAWDLITLIQRTRRSGEDVFMLGRSYGGYLVNRVLQIAPDLIRGVVLDSGAPATREATTLVAASRPTEAGGRVLGACKKDAVCAAHLGADPATFARAALAAVDHCAALTTLGWSRELVQQLLSVGLESPLRGLIPPAFFRLSRCTPDDAKWFDRLATQVVATPSLGGSGSARRSSVALFAHILLSELIGGPAPKGSLPTEETTDVFSIAHELEPYDGVYDSWPRYPADEWTDAWASADTPRLVLHGAMDSRVPLGAARQIMSNAPPSALRFVEFPTGKHLIVGQNPDANGADCGVELVQGFLLAPDAAVDTSCALTAAPLAFTAPVSILKSLAPSGDPWN